MSKTVCEKIGCDLKESGLVPLDLVQAGGQSASLPRLRHAPRATCFAVFLCQGCFLVSYLAHQGVSWQNSCVEWTGILTGICARGALLPRVRFPHRKVSFGEIPWSPKPLMHSPIEVLSMTCRGVGLNKNIGRQPAIYSHHPLVMGYRWISDRPNVLHCLAFPHFVVLDVLFSTCMLRATQVKCFYCRALDVWHGCLG